MRHWIFSCKQITGKISESMDRKLPLLERMGIRFHLMMCKLCTRYQKQLLFIRETLRYGSDSGEGSATSSGLSDEGRKRIKKNLLNETEGKD